MHSQCRRLGCLPSKRPIQVANNPNDVLGGLGGQARVGEQMACHPVDRVLSTLSAWAEEALGGDPQPCAQSRERRQGGLGAGLDMRQSALAHGRVRSRFPVRELAAALTDQMPKLLDLDAARLVGLLLSAGSGGRPWHELECISEVTRIVA
jgi:ferric-dicitrate binding protein FerR (iron transport regulator)